MHEFATKVEEMQNNTVVESKIEEMRNNGTELR